MRSVHRFILWKVQRERGASQLWEAVLPPGHAPAKARVHGHGVVRTRLPVQAHTAAGAAPLVIGVSFQRKLLLAIKPLPIGAVVEVFTDLPAEAEGGESPLLGPPAAHEQPALRVFGAFGDDVDDAVDGIGTPHARSWSADDLDALNVLQRVVHRVPEYARGERTVDGAPVHLHEQFVLKARVETAHADRPFVAVDAGHVHARHHPEKLGNLPRARAPDHLRRDDKHGCGRLGDGALLARDGRHADVHQLLDGGRGEGWRFRGIGVECSAGQARCDAAAEQACAGVPWGILVWGLRAFFHGGLWVWSNASEFHRHHAVNAALDLDERAADERAGAEFRVPVVQEVLADD